MARRKLGNNHVPLTHPVRTRNLSQFRSQVQRERVILTRDDLGKIISIKLDTPVVTCPPFRRTELLSEG